MRSGLVFVGGMLAVLGVAALVAFNLFPTTTERREAFSTVPQPFGPDSVGAALLPGSDSDSGRLTVTWQATVPIDVQLYPATGCTRPERACATEPAVATWLGVSSGQWSVSGGLRFPYLIVWNESSSTSGNFTASGVESTEVAVPPNVVDALLVDGSAAALSTIGAVAVFLGLFLRPGVYRVPAPLVSRSADDVQDLAEPPQPPRR